MAQFDKLTSDKIIERKKAREDLLLQFTTSRAVREFNDAKGKAAWHVLFGNLSACVTKEIESHSKPSGGDTAKRRVLDAAITFRTMVERSHLLWKGKDTVSSVLEHLMSNVWKKGELYEPVASEYLKTLVTVISHAPHRTRLGLEQWKRLVELAFRVILEDAAPRKLRDEVDEDEEEPLAENKRRRTDSQSLPDTGPLFSSPSSEQKDANKLLAYLLGSDAPLLSCERIDDIDDNEQLLLYNGNVHGYLPTSILSRIRRCIQIFTPDNTLYPELLQTLCTIMPTIALNRREATVKFSQRVWMPLLTVWEKQHARQPQIKESLIILFHQLLPYFVAKQPGIAVAAAFDPGPGLDRIYTLFQSGSLSKGNEPLRLESFRLRLRDTTVPDNVKAFEYATFCANSGLQAPQVLAWAAIDLQALCTTQLLKYSESYAGHLSSSSPVPNSPLTLKKRPRNESNSQTNNGDPITRLLYFMREKSKGIDRRVRALQVFLFILDQSWSTFYEDLRTWTMDVLQELMVDDASEMQPWAFLCLAAIAFNEGHASTASAVSTSIPKDLWLSCWTHALRRVTVTATCRAACHFAHTLLNFYRPHAPSASRAPLGASDVLHQIENLIKDVDIQGPSYPFDSTCHFLALCLQISSQDSRLYRLHLDEKVLAWLQASWKDNDSGQLCHTISDMLLLLESICGIPHEHDVTSMALFPDGPVARALAQHCQEKVLRDFSISGQLPPAYPQSTPSLYKANDAFAKDELPPDSECKEPDGVVLRVVSFLQKRVQQHMEDDKGLLRIPAYVAFDHLSDATLALLFQALLRAQALRIQRHLVHASQELLLVITEHLMKSEWDVQQKALVATALDGLVSRDTEVDMLTWIGMIYPQGDDTGVPRQTRRALARVASQKTSRVLQRMIWRDMHSQETLAKLCPIMLKVLEQGLGIDQVDTDFAPTPMRVSSLSHAPSAGILGSKYALTSTCLAVLILSPVLRSTSTDAPRHQELLQLLKKVDIGKNTPQFLVTLICLFRHIEADDVSLGSTDFIALSDIIGVTVKKYDFSNDELALQVAVIFMHSTLSIWLGTESKEVAEKAEQLRDNMAYALSRGHVRYWRVRDMMAQFLSRWLEVDPSCQNYAEWIALEDAPNAVEDVDMEEDERSKEDELDQNPAALLLDSLVDEDIRIRFRSATLVTKLFSAARKSQYIGSRLYGLAKAKLDGYNCTSNFDFMITRLLVIGNIIVASSQVRRMAYYHCLEVAFHRVVYDAHLLSILKEASTRTGLLSVAHMFKIHAFQMVRTMDENDQEISKLRPSLLGYDSQRDCATSSFKTFATSRLLDGVSRQRFAAHCDRVGLEIDDGIAECFGDVIGYKILQLQDRNHDFRSFQNLGEVLMSTVFMTDSHLFKTKVIKALDKVVAAILSSLSAQDEHPIQELSDQLQTLLDVDKYAIFTELTRYRQLDVYPTHLPTLPFYSAVTIIRSLQWLSEHLESEMEDLSISYHVVQQLFADVHRNAFVNEQIRLTNAITLWMACRSKDFSSSRILLLRTMQSACSLLSMPDIARAAQSMLEWLFSQYVVGVRQGIQDDHFPGILIRACEIAHRYSHDADADISQLGQTLLHWMTETAVQLYSIGHRDLCRQIRTALSVWPQEVPNSLRGALSQLTPTDISFDLGRERISSNKFHLVRQMREQGLFNKDSFAQKDFWRLKESIPPSAGLSERDSKAFAKLLTINEGAVASFGLSHGTNRSNGDQLLDPKVAVTSLLLHQLADDDPTKVYAVYKTLQCILLSLYGSPDMKDVVWPPDEAEEIEFLRSHPRVLVHSKPRTLQDLKKDPSYLSVSNDFSTWCSSVAGLLVDVLASKSTFYPQLRPILGASHNLSQSLLPLLVQALLKPELRTLESEYRMPLSQYFSAVLSAPHTCIPCLKLVIDVALHMRTFRVHDGTGPDATIHERFLDLDFLLLAQKAILCGYYTTALLFLELRADGKGMPDDAMDVMYAIYNNIDEPDGFYGIQDNNHSQYLLRQFRHEGKWEHALRFHGAGIESKSSGSFQMDGVVDAFHSLGFNRLAFDLRKGAPLSSSDASRNQVYSLGWKTGEWDLPEREGNRIPGYSLYAALRACYRSRDNRSINRVIVKSLREEIRALQDMATENITQIRETVQSLMCISQIVDWASLQKEQAARGYDQPDDGWQTLRDVEPGLRFQDLQAIMGTRISLIQASREQEKRRQIASIQTPLSKVLVETEIQCLIRISQAARGSNQKQIALNAVFQAQDLSHGPHFGALQEFAHVLWQQGEQKQAIQVLSDLRALSSPQEQAALDACLGTWTSEARLAKATVIAERFFKPAASSIKSSMKQVPSLAETAATIYHQYASFAERRYREIQSSSEVRRSKIYLERVRTQLSLNSDVTAMAQHKKDEAVYNQLKTENESCLSVAIEMYAQCLEASDIYDDEASIRLASLWMSNFNEIWLPPVISRAFERVPSRKLVFLAHQFYARLMPVPEQPEKQSKSSEREGRRVQAEIATQKNLRTLVIRMCQEHPFHSVYQLFSLLPLWRKLPSPLKSETTRSGRSSEANLIPGFSKDAEYSHREQAASDIWTQLTASQSSQRILDVQKLAEACTLWAKHLVKREKLYTRKKESWPIPDRVKLRQKNEPEHPSQDVPRLPEYGVALKTLHDLKVPVMTAHTPLDPTMRYENCVWFGSFEKTFTIASGNARPKINVCVDSEGNQHKQLFKGEDDLRQDAVMEQVFELVNKMLTHDGESRRRSLRIRDYRVIPLDPTGPGVLEYVDQTSTIKDIVEHTHNQHCSFPPFVSFQRASNELKLLQKSKKEEIARTKRTPGFERLDSNSKAQQIAAAEQLFLTKWEDLCKKVPPSFRHYFTEANPIPTLWFAMRLKYIRSVATSSIIGHILGLGDRHPSNILLDNRSGEIVPIDLGIAFDQHLQGKLLPVPETVPFRLTAQILDGMGISGSEGVFQRCAEETLRTLRERSEIVMTVLEVFRHDPLQKWVTSEKKTQKVQNDEKKETRSKLDVGRDGELGIDLQSGLADEQADRALTSVAQKLDKNLSVTTVVRGLIAEATDSSNLFQLYHGWQAYI